MKFSMFNMRARLRGAGTLWLALTISALGQTPLPQQNVVHIVPIDLIKVHEGEDVQVPLTVQVDDGFHVNSNKPADEFLIPLRLTWNAGPLKSTGVMFPKPHLGNYTFSAKPVSVFTGKFAIVTRFKIASGVPPGTVEISGKLHYQACNEKSCLTPKTVEIQLPLEIVKGANSK